jgi:germination protein M
MIAALLAIFLLFAFTGCGDKNQEEPYEEIPAANISDDPGLRNTILYLEDDNGYIVPVMKQIPWVEGIGAATVTQLIANPDADAEMEYLGLNPILKEDTELSLSIKEGVATLKLSKDAISAENAVDEMNKVVALVNTLAEFQSIDSVLIKQEGCGEELPCGTVISQPFIPFDLNVITTLSQEDQENASRLVLYFPNESGTIIVPVTTYVGGKADPFAAMSELVKGPGEGGLKSLFPEDTSLLGVDVDDEGVAAVNFSKEFNSISDDAQQEKALVRCITLTMMQFDNVEEVRILVEGKEFSGAAEATMAYPDYINVME